MANKVNGKVYDWADITINLPHGQLILVSDISYKGGLEIEEVYGKGGMPQGWGRGNYKGEGSLTLLREEFDKFVEWLKGQGKSTLQSDPFPITVSYSDYDSVMVTDTLHDCKIKGDIEINPKQGDKKVEVKLNFAILKGIEHNGAKDYAEPK